MARVTKNRSSTSFQSSAALFFRPTIMAVIASSLTMAEKGYCSATAPVEMNTRHKDGSVLNTLARVILKPNVVRILPYMAPAIIWTTSCAALKPYRGGSGLPYYK